MTRALAIRFLLLASVVVLLATPITQTLDRHDHFTPADTELNLCVLAVLATAGVWAFADLALGVALKLRRAPAAAVTQRQAAEPMQAAVPTASPPAFALLRI